MKQIPTIIKEELDKTGLPWEIQTGGKHYHIVLNKKMVGIISKGSREVEGRTLRNCISQIRRAARGMSWSTYHSAQQ